MEREFTGTLQQQHEQQRSASAVFTLTPRGTEPTAGDLPQIENAMALRAVAGERYIRQVMAHLERCPVALGR